MKIAIIGPPQSGKTTAFKILLQKEISGNIGHFKVEDYRIEKIAQVFSSKKKTFPEFTFIDLGSVSGQLHDIDLFICVVGAFFSQDPKKDFESFLLDFILSDIDVLQSRIARIEKEKKGPEAEQELKILQNAQTYISEGSLLCKAGLEKDEVKLLSGLVLLTLKPMVAAINVSDEDKNVLESKLKPLEEFCSSKNINCIRFFGKIESEIMELEQEDREKFLKELGAGYNFRRDLPKLIARELDIITFITTGEKETRGWFLKEGLPVIEAAGKVHTDMKRGFIRAEVVNFEDFVKCGSMHKAREAGVLKVEGKEYVVQDGDIINIRFNV